MENPAGHIWCAYSNEQQWRDAVQSSRARNVATAELAGDRISVLHLTRNDPMGDWVARDTYSFDKNGMLRSLNRTINIISTDITAEEDWMISGGKATKQRSTIRNLKTQQPVNRPDIHLPDVAVIVNGERFPFWRLIQRTIGTSDSMNCTK